LDGAGAAFAEPRPAASSARAGAADGRVAATIGGQVLAVPVREGERVARGQCVAVIEAMKMEHRVGAPRDGVVRRIAVSPGDQVAARQALMVVEQGGEAGGE
ncbi:MAG: acetyl-CoA carboxylase biotin carboxyl carrier protein subunit, partial [Myxococcota bacterium]|nr:acetyl-CoA carboxylase biotin carboxyl carrier protein subunit [Myxococcota bacterium]